MARVLGRVGIVTTLGDPIGVAHQVKCAALHWLEFAPWAVELFPLKEEFCMPDPRLFNFNMMGTVGPVTMSVELQVSVSLAEVILALDVMLKYKDARSGVPVCSGLSSYKAPSISLQSVDVEFDALAGTNNPVWNQRITELLIEGAGTHAKETFEVWSRSW